MTESNRVEYKRELNDSLEKEVVGFLNYHDGGLIYLGVDDTGKTWGVQDTDSVQLRVKDRIKNNIQPSALGLFDVILEQREGKPVIKIIVASGSEKPYYLKKYGMTEKGCYIRLGSSTEPIPRNSIEEMFSRRTRNSLTRMRSPRQDLTFEQLKIYYQERGFSLNDKFASNLELLTEDGLYNLTAYLLADENGNSVQLARYEGTDRVNLLESKEYGYCSLVKTCKSILDRIEAVENKTLSRVTPKERVEYRFWNPVALREGVINALIHNDYTTELVPKIEIFDNRIEITSAGAIHNQREQEDFFSGYSMPRNKGLMRVFKDLDLVEYLGSGIPRILQAYPKKSFTFSNRFIRLTMPISPEALRKQAEEAGEKAYTYQEPAVSRLGKELGEKLGNRLGENELRVLQSIEEDEKASIALLSEKLGLSDTGIEKILGRLKSKGYLKRVGPPKGGHWEIIG